MVRGAEQQCVRRMQLRHGIHSDGRSSCCGAHAPADAEMKMRGWKAFQVTAYTAIVWPVKVALYLRGARVSVGVVMSASSVRVRDGRDGRSKE